jgi:predicted ATPase
MIDSLQIRGYRSLADVSWKPGPLNVLIGVNGSGKSNLLHALKLLSDAAAGRLYESIRRAGGMVPLLWDGQADQIEWKVRTGEFYVRGRELGPYTYELRLDQLGKTGSYKIGHELLIDGQTTILSRTDTEGSYFADKSFEIDLASLQSETLLSQRPFSSNYYDSVSNLYKYFLSWRIYHDIRVDQEAEMRRATVTRLERRVDDDGQNLVSVLHTLYSNDRTFRDEIDSAMRAAFGPEFEELKFPPAEDGRIQLRVHWRSLRRGQSAADLSDGMLRFLFLVTVLASPDPPPLIAIDEPEVGLHPSMLPIVAEHAIDAASRTQVILTTHSPEFLDAFTQYPESTTVVEWRDGKTELRPLSGRELSKWLEHYRLGQLWLSGELEEAG